MRDCGVVGDCGVVWGLWCGTLALCETAVFCGVETVVWCNVV